MKLDSIIQQQLESANEEERLAGLKSLAKSGVEQHLAVLYQAMGDPSWRVRKEAVELFFGLPQAASLAGEIIELLHSQENAGLRNAAVEILVRFGRQAVPQLLEELSCKDHDVRKFIIDILGEVGDERAMAGLLSALRDEDTNVRASAAENLGKLKVAEAAPALLLAMQTGDLMFKFTALEALALMQAQIRTDELLPLQDEKLLRKALYDCLGYVGDVDAVPVLVEALTEEMRNVAEAAAVALVRLASRHGAIIASTMQQLANQPAVESVTRLLESRNPEVRSAAVSLLGDIGDKASILSLLPLLEEQELAQQVATALVTIGRSNPAALISLWNQAETRQQVYLAYLFGEAECAECIPELHRGLRSQVADLRHAAAQSLGRLGDQSALSVLVESLNDESEEVRDAVVVALTRLGATYPEATLVSLQPLLEDENPDMRASAVTVLGRLQGVDVLRALEFAMKDESADVRRSAVRAMEGRDSDEQLQGLMLALTDEDVDVRRMSAEILGQSRNENLVDALQLALQDEDLWVRSTAVRSLGMIASRQALQKVTAALQDPVGLVVIAALETLTEHDFPGILNHLLNALVHPDEEVVNSSLKLLSSQGNLDWVASYGELLLNHKNWEVRLSAARSLAVCLGAESMSLLEARLLIEGEDLVRLELQDLLVAQKENMD